MKQVYLIVMLLFAVATAQAGVVPPPDVGIDQHIGARLPHDAPFRDDGDGREHPLGDYFQTKKPSILVMGYFGCPQLCTVVMNGLVQSLTQINPHVGPDFDVFFVSIDPRETAELGAAKKRQYVLRYGKPESAAGWHFLTGSKSSITQLTSAMGFRYQYEPELNQFAHGSGLAILTPDGRISRYFYGIEFPPQELANSLKQAAAGREGNRVTELLLLCAHYNPLTGKYGMAIWRSLQGGALLTMAGLGWIVVRSGRKRKEALR